MFWVLVAKMNTLDLVIVSISEQYGAAIKMLEDTITECRDDLWNDASGKKNLSQIVFHVLFWIDRYLSPTKKADYEFIPHIEKKDEKTIYSKEELLAYAQFVREKADEWFSIMTLDILVSDSVYDFHGSTILSSLIYDLRHIMLHVGALHVRLYNAGIKSMEWESHNILFKRD